MLGSFITITFRLLISIIDCIQYLLMGYIILGWVVFFGLVKNREGALIKIYVFLMTKMEPILGLVRRFLPPIAGLDFSALVVFFLTHMLKILLVVIGNAILRALYG